MSCTESLYLGISCWASRLRVPRRSHQHLATRIAPPLGRASRTLSLKLRRSCLCLPNNATCCALFKLVLKPLPTKKERRKVQEP
jgi:hypothetical protein